MNKYRIFNTALDIISRFASSSYPLKNVIKDVTSMRKLNSTERSKVYLIMRGYCRNYFLIVEFLKSMSLHTVLNVQQKNIFILNLIMSDDIIANQSNDIGDLKKQYDEFSSSLKNERFLIALGPWLQKKIKQHYKDRAEVVAKSLFNTPKIYVAHDERYISKNAFIKFLKDNNISYFFHQHFKTAVGINNKEDIGKIKKNFNDYVWVMDPASQLVGTLIKANKNDSVLDMCVGEGQKAKLLVQNPASITAVDIEERRLKHAKKRLKNENIKFICADATKPFNIDEKFDFILLDAPCTGIGVIRRHLDLIFRVNEDVLTKYTTLQQKLINSAIEMLKPGGKLIYSTCSLLPEENELQINKALKNNCLMKPLDIKRLIDGQINDAFDSLVSNNQLNLLPINDWDGFFIAALQKLENKQ